MLDQNIYTIISLYLTLIGLMGTFFYIHLSGWLQEMLKLHAKWKNNKLGTDDNQKNAIRECRFELKGLFNHIPILISVIISFFIVFVWHDSNILLKGNSDTLAIRLKQAIDIFGVLYFALTLYLLIHGYFVGFQIHKEANKKAGKK